MLSSLRYFFAQPGSRSVGLVFASMGFLFGNWVTRIPGVKTHFELDDGALGLLLLGFPAGVIVMNPVSPWILRKAGMRRSTLGLLPVMALCFILPVSMPGVAWTAAALVLAGMATSGLNIAMNTCAASIEAHEQRNIMGACHGMWSLGGMAGSALASVAVGMQIAPGLHMALTAALVLCIAAWVHRPIMALYEAPTAPHEGAARFAKPSTALVGMIFIGLFVNLCEGTMADWTAVYLREVVGAGSYLTGWGFSIYALLMAMGRMGGDVIINRFGGAAVLQAGGLLAAAGLLLVILFPYPLSTLIGFACVGAGVSCGAPILYGSAARIPGLAKGAGLATMNTFAMMGFLAGPAVIGMISRATSLPAAFGVVAALALAWSWIAGKTKLY